ncbi:type I 3-dehydroquinate dehydratase [Archaeoglobus sp.]
MKLVATVSNFEELNLAQDADVVELRLDIFDFRDVKVDKEKILTCRRISDGGKFEGDDVKRLELIREAFDLLNPEYVDLENDLPDSAFDFNCKIIESYHNFRETPDYHELKRIVEERRGDIVKIATMGRSKKDVEKIVRILVNYDDVVAFLMGDEFSFTRIFAAYLCSPLVYCYVGRPKAPGQLSLADAREIISMLR